MAARSPIFPKKQQSRPAEVQLPLNEDRIRSRAYEIYQRRGGLAGTETDDWLQAEAELKALRDTK